jgi:hypothetical protein
LALMAMSEPYCEFLLLRRCCMSRPPPKKGTKKNRAEFLV